MFVSPIVMSAPKIDLRHLTKVRFPTALISTTCRDESAPKPDILDITVFQP